jgi:hypothetical protein
MDRVAVVAAAAEAGGGKGRLRAGARRGDGSSPFLPEGQGMPLR